MTGQESQSAVSEQPIPVQEQLPTSYEPQADQVNFTEQHQIVSASIKTPHLPPHFLRQYDEIVPGSAKEIFDMVIRQQEFDLEIRRHDMEMNHRNMTRVEQLDAANIQEQKDAAGIRAGELTIKNRGQWFALFLSVSLIVLSGFFAYLGHIWLASIPLGIIIGVMTVMFLQTRHHQPAEVKDPPAP